MSQETKPEIPAAANKEINARGTPTMRRSEASLNDKNKSNGVLQTSFNEPIPEHSKQENEIVHQGNNNQFIIFGRDQITTPDTGYGAFQIPRAGRIELVVGKGGGRPSGTSIYDPSAVYDSAKIYISQKSNIDQHFKIATNEKSPSSMEASAIAIKADAVRILGRENIKIITGTDLNNSNQRATRKNNTITLIGGNDVSDIQPMVKGNNLYGCLTEMYNIIHGLAGTVADFLELQHDFNLAVSSHIHQSPFYGQPTEQSPTVANMRENLNLMLSQVRASLSGHTGNIKNNMSKYLIRLDKDASPILSSYNFLN